MASAYALFPAKIVTPDGLVFEGEVRQVQVSSDAGGLGILARRSPIVADLGLGRTAVELEDGTWSSWATEEGFAQASNSTATVVVEEAVRAEDVDAAAAAQQATEAKARLEAAEQAGDGLAARAARRELAWAEHLARFQELHG